MRVEQINFSRLKCTRLKRLVKKQASRARRRDFRRFLITGMEPPPRVIGGWLD